MEKTRSNLRVLGSVIGDMIANAIYYVASNRALAKRKRQ